ncbi:MAG: tripartite tricarboxylate transporter substrate binding protein [Acetobacteraceae bacterium]|nr:tripartite tricarboxylate transporter substrate binding protein [Acetobacteraceae bacterium]
MRILLLLALSLFPAVAGAWPDHPITIINPYATGSSTDATARALAESFSATLGQPVVVTSREGGSGVIGLRALAASPADGHMLAYSPLVPLAVQPHLVRNTGLGPDAVAPVCNVTENILGIMVRADSPWRDLPALVGEAKHRPLAFGSPGPNSAPYLGVHRIQMAAGGEYTHLPFRGDNASLVEVLAGRLDFAAIVVASGVPMARAGQMRLLASLSTRRHPEFPDVPTAKEQGIEAVQLSYAGLFAPRGTPGAVLDRLEEACRTAIQSEVFARAAAQWGLVPDFLGRHDFAARLAAEYAAHGRVLRELGVAPQ